MANKNLLQLIRFEDKSIRRVWYDGEWYFAIVDVVAACSDSKNPSGYLKDMRRRDPELAKGWGQIATPLKVPTKGGMQSLNCANTESCLRIIQSIPSPEAEPFKKWLAKVGRERLEESENPQLGLDRAIERAIEEYKIRGRDPNWIMIRLQSKQVRDRLTQEWKNRGVKEGEEFAFLTAMIHSGIFGLAPSEHKSVKGLKKHHDLRDHMTDLELGFTIIGEAAARQQSIRDEAQGFSENATAAKKGGHYAGKALDTFEKESGMKVVSENNFLEEDKKARKKLSAFRKKKKE